MRFQPDSPYYGDCLDVMRQWPAGCVDLCYLDPPFNSKANYNVLFGKDSVAMSTVRFHACCGRLCDYDES